MGTPEFRRAFAALAADYAASLPLKLVELDRLWDTVREDPVHVKVDALRRVLHTVAGAAGTFGFAALTDSARAAEHFLAPLSQPDAKLAVDDYARFEGLLKAVHKAAAPPAA